jgi:hypothetical protein
MPLDAEVTEEKREDVGLFVDLFRHRVNDEKWRNISLALC